MGDKRMGRWGESFLLVNPKFILSIAKVDYLLIAVLGQVRYTFIPEAPTSRRSTVLHQLKNRYNSQVTTFLSFPVPIFQLPTPNSHLPHGRKYPNRPHRKRSHLG